MLDKNIDIKGVIEKSQAKGRYSQSDRMRGFGLDVKEDGNPYNMHHKVFIIDNRTVIAGSMNPSRSGGERNDENLMIIHDKTIAEEFLREFERIWKISASSPLP
jgi:phosphatidylserine/phosphatidylglycerophosphate/cardiolipin synthase-like enzyme